MEKIECTQCGENKTVDNYWFDKRRNKHQTPCKECRNLNKKMRRKEMFINNKFTKSELDKSYRLKGIPEEIREVVVANIMLNREIEKTKDVQITGNGDVSVIYCPICAESEALETPINLKEFFKLGDLFEKSHAKCRKK